MIKHLLAILVASLTTTIFMMPISTTDALVVATLNSVSPFITIPLLVLVDMATAILAYNGATLLIGLLFKKQSKRDYIANIGAKLGNKRGYALIVIAAATPFPYTLTIYAAGDTIMVELSDYSGAGYSPRVLTIHLSGTGTATTRAATIDKDYLHGWSVFNGTNLRQYGFSCWINSSNSKQIYFGAKRYIQGSFSGSTIAWTTGDYTMYVGKIWKV